MFKSVHLALPVNDLEASIAFFQVLCAAHVIAYDAPQRRATVAYDHIEMSLFEMRPFALWSRAELGPFHIGHEVLSRADVDHLFARAVRQGYDVVSAPFEREDGDYAFFVKDSQGLVYEFFCGGHHIARSRLQHKLGAEQPDSGPSGETR